MKSMIFILALVSFSAHANTVARVLDVKGKAFSFNSGKEPMVLKYGDKIQDLSDVMVEDSSHLSIVNTEGHVFHITGGSLVKLFKRNLEVKNGQIWTVSKNNSYQGSVNTTNAVVEYQEGQFVLSFDNISGKTQVLVITGDLKFANSVEPNLNTKVSAGYFSIVDPDYENNLPRTPTRIGKNSFKQVRSSFAGFDALNNSSLDKMMPTEKKTTRAIASVVEGFTGQKNAKRGKLIKLYKGSGRNPASAINYYNKIKKASKGYAGPSAKVRYFGKKWQAKKRIKTNLVQNKIDKTESKPAAKRMPASIPTAQPEPSGAQNLMKELNGFEGSVKKKESSIQRHSDDVNFLIDNLKSYKKDFQKNY